MVKNIIERTQKFCSGYYNLLLLFIILLFVFRPYNRSEEYIAIWKLCLAGTILSSIFNCHHKRIIKWIASCLAVPSVFLGWMNFFHPSEVAFVGNAVCTILFMFTCVGSILYDVVLRAHVTLETLRGVICAYFMVAFAFAYVYFMLEYLVPGTFQFAQGEISIFSYTNFISEMFYFSFVTLLTIGYGDIVAVKDVGQTATVLEGVIGQFYVAILVARLVSVYSFYSDKRLIRALEKDKEKKNKKTTSS
ncbi:MAG: two pore domain potassium channel family protein [Verrucomicrobia bacterium]|nr:two pore domain potassium channel family protein [Verrucomicrobiota bacterium]